MYLASTTFAKDSHLVRRNSYPNNGHFNVQFQNLNSENLVLNILNLIGQVVYSEKIQPTNSLNMSINLSHLSKGIYNINIIEKEKTLKTQKMIIN